MILGSYPSIFDASGSTLCSRLAYGPMAERLLEPAGGIVQVELPPGAYQHVAIVAKPDHPRLLFALGARRRASEAWDNASRRLRLAVEGVEGARIRFTVYSPAGAKSLVNARGENVPFEWSAASGLVRFEAVFVPGDRFELQF